jgi:CBS domain containing-hemolysin-like protein
LRFEILQSTQRRVERVRISVADPETVHQPPNPQSNRETR